MILGRAASGYAKDIGHHVSRRRRSPPCKRFFISPTGALKHNRDELSILGRGVVDRDWVAELHSTPIGMGTAKRTRNRRQRVYRAGRAAKIQEGLSFYIANLQVRRKQE
jgi:hypothetical protein